MPNLTPRNSLIHAEGIYLTEDYFGAFMLSPDVPAQNQARHLPQDMPIEKPLDDKLLVMYLREILLDYFKGGCKSVMQLPYELTSRIQTSGTMLRQQYQYERQEQAARRATDIYVDGILVIAVHHRPDKATVYNNSYIGKELVMFFKTYLAGVELTIKED